MLKLHRRIHLFSNVTIKNLNYTVGGGAGGQGLSKFKYMDSQDDVFEQNGEFHQDLKCIIINWNGKTEQDGFFFFFFLKVF